MEQGKGKKKDGEDYEVMLRQAREMLNYVLVSFGSLEWC